MQSLYFTEDHHLFRQSVKEFVDREVIPNIHTWEKDEQIPREVWKRMGELGFLGINIEEKYGGSHADFFFSVAFVEEISKCGIAGLSAAVSVHQYMSIAHILEAGSEDLKQKYVTKAITGEYIGALGITEPNAGSDVANIKTTAKREGDYYVVNGSKTFITNGYYSDFITAAVKTNPDSGIQGVSLIVIDTNLKGVCRSKLNKIGWKSSDTAEISFDNVKVPVSNLIGEEGKAFYYIMGSFQLERLVTAIMAMEGAQHALNITIKYMHEREAFGRPISKFQVLRHRFADYATEIEACRQFIYHTSWLFSKGEFVVKQCSMVKLLATELAKKVVDGCLQAHGGFGYMEDYEIARMYRDIRATTIVGGTSEIMKEIISKIVIDETSYDDVYQKNGNTKTNNSSPLTTKEAPLIVAETASEIIKSLEKRLRTDKAKDVNTLVHFDLSGEKGGLFSVLIEDGTCSVKEGLVGTPKCIVKAKAKVYEEIELGKKNAEMAVLMGKMKISNISEMKNFSRLFNRLY